MIYDISMPRTQFDLCVDIVKKSALPRKPRTLKMITSNLTQLTPANQDYILSDPACMGVTFMYKGEEEDCFDIWISPRYTEWSNSWSIDTVLHELSHGYAGAMNHGQRFRRVLGESLHRYDQEVHPILVELMVTRMVDRYSKDDLRTRELEKDFTRKAASRAKSLVRRAE